ncbi:MAG: cysteine desulfurase [Bacteroidetes bacterium]|nr:cysteine desulfurase [Bacteroidota bacterium]
MKKIYLDHSATTPVDPEVVDAMLPYLREEFGNPSSAHGYGRSAKIAMETSREKIAALINARPSEIVFTGSGSEADNMAILGAAFTSTSSRRHVISNAIEHHAVLHSVERLADKGFNVTLVANDGFGMIHPESVAEAIRPDTFLLSVMHANNEIGTINPIAEMGGLAREKGVIFHVDAVQTVGKIPIDVNSMQVDLLAASAHKMYGPKGIGFLYVRQGVRLDPLVVGGSQERGHRAGTENIAGIVGFGKAADIARARLQADQEKLTQLHTELLFELKRVFPDLILNGHPSARLPGHLNVSIGNVAGDELLMMLDLRGIAISTGSACTSGSIQISHVLSGVQASSGVARGAIRISMGRSTNREDFSFIVSSIKSCVEKMTEAPT